MEVITNILYYVVPFIVLLGILVFVHELGHFLVARALGVKVDEFSLGFGKELWGRDDKKGTRWKICAVPLGGYCKFFGDEDASSVAESEKLKDLSDDEKKHVFQLMPPSRRILIALAGPAANYLFAILVFATIFWSFGKMTFPPVVGEVIMGSAAEKAGILANDRILEINGKKINDFDDIRYEVDLAVDGKVNVVLQRGDDVKTLDFVLEKISNSEDGVEAVRPMLGVKSVNVVELDQKPLSLLEAFRDASIETWDITAATLRGVGQMLTGKRGGEDVGGIIRIAELSGDISKQNGWIDLGNGDWDYYVDGQAFTGWYCSATDIWYYVRDGHMLRNTWVWRDANSAYYVGNDGVMLYGPATTPDGYAIDANGLWHR